MPEQPQFNHLPAGLQAAGALMKCQAEWEPWKAFAVAMTTGGAWVGVVSAAIVFPLHASGKD